MQSAVYIAAMGVMLAAVKADSGSGEPGYCKDDKSCEDNYVCISVQTTRSGIEDVKQCLPYEHEGDVCSGTFPGLCPSFSTWKTAFQSISSVCAYQLPSGTDKCLEGSKSGSSKNGYVSCVNIQGSVNSTKSSPKSYGVIYGCVDYDGTNLLFDEESKNWDLSSQMNYTAVIGEGCVNPTNGENSDVVCSGRGTCAPGSSGGMDYKCHCNVGYNGTYCQKIVSNKCTLESQCQAGTCNLVTKECECDAGTTGDQCAYCDPSSPKACNGHGKCVAASSSSSTSSSTNTISGLGEDVSANSSSLLSSSTNTISSQGQGSGGAQGQGSSGVQGQGSSGVQGQGSSGAQGQGSGEAQGQRQGSSSRFLAEKMGMASSSSSGSGGEQNVCKCESGYTGDQCTRVVDSGSKSDSGKKRGSTSSDAASVATSIFLVASVFVVALLN